MAPIQADLVVNTDTETSLELSWVGISSEPFKSAFWDVTVNIIPPPPEIADFPSTFSVVVTHLAAPHGEGGPGAELTVDGAFGGFVAFPDIRFPPAGETPYVHDEATLTHESFGGFDHIDVATLSGTQITSGGFPMDSFVLQVEHAIVPEPSSIALIGLGLLGMVGFLRRK